MRNDEPLKYKKSVTIAFNLASSTVKTPEEWQEAGAYAVQYPLTQKGFEIAKQILTEKLEAFLITSWQQYGDDNADAGFN